MGGCVFLWRKKTINEEEMFCYWGGTNGFSVKKDKNVLKYEMANVMVKKIGEGAKDVPIGFGLSLAMDEQAMRHQMGESFR